VLSRDFFAALSGTTLELRFPMKIRRSALLSSLLLGAIPAIAAVATILPAEAAPETAGAAAAAPALALEVMDLHAMVGNLSGRKGAPESPERSMLTEEGDETECGDYFWALTPDNGVSGEHAAPSKWTATVLAEWDARDKLIAYSKIKCAYCPVPNECVPLVFTFDTGWSMDLFQTESGTWQAVATYTGLYQAYCTDCPE
jgi:hypothetical protein